MIDYKATRDAVGEALLEKGLTNDRIVVLTADLKESTRVNLFAEKFPDSFFDCGVAEQGMITIAAGLANYGKIPFVSSYAIFSVGRVWEQIRTTVALNNLPVKIIGGHTGLSAVLDGGNHQMLEDIALMRSLPNMVVVVPADYLETKKAVVEAVGNRRPTYIRVVREATPVFTTPKSVFKIGKAEVLFETRNPQVAIVACGPLVYEALVAAKQLEKSGIDTLVINNHTIKPIDERSLIHAAKITGAVVTVEEHQVMGGMGSAVAEVLARNFPIPVEFVGMPDSFGESGKYDELMKKYGLTSKNIIEAVKKVLVRTE